MRRCLILGGILLIAIPSIGFGQSQRLVKGYVMDENNRPLPEASVSVDGKTFTRVAEDGSFSISVSYMVPSITAYSEGYLPEEKKIDGSYLIFKMKVDTQAEKNRLAAAEKARKEAESKLKAEEAAREKAEKDRLAAIEKAEKDRRAAIEKARKESETKLKAEEIAIKKAEKERLAEEEKNRKEAEAKLKAEEAANKKAEAREKADQAAWEKAQKKAVRQDKEKAYNASFRNRGIEQSISFSYAYSMDECQIEYVYSGYREYGTLHPFEIDYTLSYRFNRIVSAGVGTGFLFNAKSITIINDSFSPQYGDFREQRIDVPVYGSFRLTPLRTRVRPYVSGSIGYYILSRTMMGEGDLGVDFRFGGRSSIQISLMVRTTPYPFPGVGEGTGYYSRLSPGVKLGMSF